MRKFKGGLFNPLGTKNAHFDYEVLDSKEVVNVEYQSDGDTYVIPECKVLLRSLSGWTMFSDKFICTLSGDDALKYLRQGEIISADLCFGVKNDESGGYVQDVKAENVITVNDFFQIREAQAIYESSFTKDNQKAD